MDKRNPVCTAMQKLLTIFQEQEDLRKKVCEYVIKNNAIPDSEKRDIFLQILQQQALTEQDYVFLFKNREWATPTIDHLLDFANAGHLLEGIVDDRKKAREQMRNPSTWR